MGNMEAERLDYSLTLLKIYHVIVILVGGQQLFRID